MEIKTAFTPLLAITNGVTDIDFYKQAFGAVEQMRVSNDDGSIHVAEFTIDDALFHLHEVTQWSGTITPQQASGGTVSIG